MKGESQDTYLTFGENSISKASSVEEEFNLANFEHPYLVSKNFPRYVVGLVRSAKT